MGIQNNINAMLGTAAGAAAMGKHISEQAKANEIKTAETEAQASVAEEEAKQARENLTKSNKDFWRDQTNENILEEVIKTGHPKDNDDLIDKALNIKLDKAQAVQNEAFADKILNYKDTENDNQQKINANLSKNLEMADRALAAVEGEVESRRKLKFDLELKRKKAEAYKLMLEKGGKR